MGTADKVLEILEDNKGGYVSGGEIAKTLGVSRNAVWKSVNTLKAGGYSIDAVTNKGYSLDTDCKELSARSIKKYIKSESVAVDYRRSVTSTNTVMRSLAENGEKEGYLLVSSEQTAGKGRRGRSFVSKSGTGVYFSLLLRPDLSPSDSLLITTCAACAVAKAIEKNTGRRTEIKWVNDIFVDGKKVCGILTEASIDLEGGGLSWAVLGIGINLFFPDGTLPEELRGVAGSVFENDSFGADDAAKLVADTVNFFMENYYSLTEKAFLEDYRSRSYLDGKQVIVIKNGKEKKGEALGIDDDFRLKVKYDDGSEEKLSSGEVSTRII